jgi:hypothetical protein
VLGVTEHVALPLVERGNATHPLIEDPLSVNATVPPGGIGLTVAVSVTDCPTSRRLAEDDTPIDVPVAWTVTVKVPVATPPWSSTT